MKILSSIQLGKPRGAAPSCRHCAHFQNDPAVIEATYRGLNIMSSGLASVRDQDGLCNLHQLYLSARDSCPHFRAPAKTT